MGKLALTRFPLRSVPVTRQEKVPVLFVNLTTLKEDLGFDITDLMAIIMAINKKLIKLSVVSYCKSGANDET